MFMPTNQNQAKWSYNPDTVETDDSPPTRQKSQQSISWTASEFIHHHKSGAWYMAFFGALIAISAVIFIFTKDYIATVTIVLAGIIFSILANRKPRELNYEVTEQGIQIGGQFYEYGNFKYFTIEQEEGIKSINLMPMKRFMPDISVYFPSEQEDTILNLLASHLPHDYHEVKPIDKLAKRLRF